MAALFTSSKFAATDASGNPLAGGFVHTYAAGTLTPKATYTTQAGDIANTNPVELDSTGRASIWLASGAYKFVVTDSTGSAAPDGTVDNITSPSLEVFADLANSTTAGKGFSLVAITRTAAEVSAGVTISRPEFPPGDVRRYGAVGDWNGSTGTDDKAAIAAAFAVVQAAGSGVVDFGSLRYRMVPADGATVAALSSCRGVEIRGAGAEIAIDRTFTGSVSVTVFELTACTGVAFGDFVATCTSVQPFGEKTTRGPVWAKFKQGTIGVTAGSLKITGFKTGYSPERTSSDPASYISRNLSLGTINAYRCGYPINTASSGEGLSATIYSRECGRSFFPQGSVSGEVWVNSTDHEGSADVLIASDQGAGANGLRLHYTNTQSTVADNSRDCVRVEHQDGDVAASVHRELDVHLNIQTSAASWLGFGFAVGKRTAADAADTVDRGHTLQGVRVHGLILAGSSNQRSIGFCNVGTWGAGENVQGIDFSQLRIDGTSQPSINLASLKDRCTIDGLVSGAQVNITGNTTGIVAVTSSHASAWSYTGQVTFDGAYRGSAVFDPPSLAAGATQQTTVTVTGAAVGDSAAASFSVANAGIVWLAEVTGVDTVTVTQWNRSGSPVDLVSGTLRCSVSPRI